MGLDPGQSAVDRFFAAHAHDWKSIYEKDDVNSVIQQLRMAQAQAFVERIPANPQGRALEVGCGAGLMTVWLAERGMTVNAVDTVPSMLDLTRTRVTESGVADRVDVALGDIQSLPFAANTFQLVVALGVVPWVSSPPTAVAELARVLQPAGFLIVNVGNRLRLTGLVDPMENRFLLPLRQRTKSLVNRMGDVIKDRKDPTTRPFTPGEFDQLLSTAGLEKVDSRIFGFGQFTFLHRPILPKRSAVAFHWRLQRLADRGLPFFRSAGSQYLVLARKAADNGQIDKPANRATPSAQTP